MNLLQNKARKKLSLLGTSLVEVLLTLVLVLALIGSAVISFSGTHAATALREGADRFESLIQFARAEASLTGKKHRLVFVENTNNTAGASLKVATLEVESNPLTAPGVFTKVTSSAVVNAELDDMIGVEAVKIPGVNKSPIELVEAEEAPAADDSFISPEDELGSITFYPDGSSDSVEIILAPVDAEQKSRVAVRLSGVTGTVSREFIEPGSSDFDSEGEEELWEEESPAAGNDAFESTATATTFSTKSDDVSLAATH